mmetsp:Transcript_35387/g.69410  ORF Transcript_35387/g.69410 Transcript_35387/m.69410 type:complete len:456 (-) Transcript_35387:107-1474(-)
MSKSITNGAKRRPAPGSREKSEDIIRSEVPPPPLPPRPREHKQHMKDTGYGIVKELVVVITLITVYYVLSVFDQFHKGGPPAYSNFIRLHHADHLGRKVIPFDPEKRCLVTGATGMIGVTLVKELLEQDWDVTVFHRPTSNLTTLKSLELNHGKLRFTEGDITDEKTVVEAIPQGLPVVFHLASLTERSHLHNDKMYAVNVLGTRHVAHSAFVKKVSKLVVLSSGEVFEYQPDCSREGTFVTERSQRSGERSWMGLAHTKSLAEREVRHFIFHHGLNATFINPGIVIGKYSRNSHYVTTLVTQAQDEFVQVVGYGKRSFVHSKQVARAAVNAAKFGKSGINYLLGEHYVDSRNFMEELTRVVNGGSSGHILPIPSFVLYSISVLHDFAADVFEWLPGLTGEMEWLMSCRVPELRSFVASAHLGFTPGQTSLRDQLVELNDWVSTLPKQEHAHSDL